MTEFASTATPSIDVGNVIPRRVPPTRTPLPLSGRGPVPNTLSRNEQFVPGCILTVTVPDPPDTGKVRPCSSAAPALRPRMLRQITSARYPVTAAGCWPGMFTTTEIGCGVPEAIVVDV